MNAKIKTAIRKTLKVVWRLSLCIGILFVAEQTIRHYVNRRQLKGVYYEERLTDSVSVHRFRFQNDEVRVYNQATKRYTLKGLQWVADAPSKDSLTVFCRNGKRGFLNVKTGEMAIAEQYRRAWIFSEGVAAVMRDGKIGFINSRNETVLPFDYDYADRNGMAIDYLFRSGYCTMTNARGACGLIDTTGKWVVEPLYDCIWPPHGGKYRIVKDGDKYGLLNEKMEFIFPIEYDYIEFSNAEGVLLSQGGYKWQADYNGTVTQPFVCDYTEHISYASGYDYYMAQDPYGGEQQYSKLAYTLSDYLKYAVNGKLGVVRKDNGKVIIPALYDQINMLSPDLFEAKDPQNYEWILIDTQGRIVKK